MHSYTFRDGKRYLPCVYGSEAQAGFLQFYRAGIDGVFTGFADTGVAVRAVYLKETGH